MESTLFNVVWQTKFYMASAILKIRESKKLKYEEWHVQTERVLLLIQNNVNVNRVRFAHYLHLTLLSFQEAIGEVSSFDGIFITAIRTKPRV